jgi:recombination protein RecT
MAETNEAQALIKINNSLVAKTKSIMDLVDAATANRIRTTFMFQCRKVPKLLDCSLGSIAQAFTDAATIGLEPNGIHAHLIPYGKECKYMPDYKGFIRLARESGEVADMTANVVRKNDLFEHEYGTNKHLKHVKAYGTDKERGDRIAAYSYVKFKDGSEDFRVLTEGEVMHAKESSKSGNIWKNDPDPMWAKTAVRQHAKFLPSQKKLQLAAEMDEVMDLKDADMSEVTTDKTLDNKEDLKKKLKDKKESKPDPTAITYEEEMKQLCVDLGATTSDLVTELAAFNWDSLGEILLPEDQVSFKAHLKEKFG